MVGRMIGSSMMSMRVDLPGNFLRASTYPAGTPAASAMSTTATLTSNVTNSDLLIPVSFHAWPYHRVVNASGHHPARQLVAKEVMATEPSTASASNTKHPPANQVITLVTVTRESRRTGDGRSCAGRADSDAEVMALSLSTRCRAAVDTVTHGNQHNQDDKLDHGHDHCDGCSGTVIGMLRRSRIDR